MLGEQPPDVLTSMADLVASLFLIIVFVSKVVCFCVLRGGEGGCTPKKLPDPGPRSKRDSRAHSEQCSIPK